jgi:hypothetical protein
MMRQDPRSHSGGVNKQTGRRNVLLKSSNPLSLDVERVINQRNTARIYYYVRR